MSDYEIMGLSSNVFYTKRNMSGIKNVAIRLGLYCKTLEQFYEKHIVDVESFAMVSFDAEVKFDGFKKADCEVIRIGEASKKSKDAYADMLYNNPTTIITEAIETAIHNGAIIHPFNNLHQKEIEETAAVYRKVKGFFIPNKNIVLVISSFNEDLNTVYIHMESIYQTWYNINEDFVPLLSRIVDSESATFEIILSGQGKVYGVRFHNGRVYNLVCKFVEFEVVPTK